MVDSGCCGDNGDDCPGDGSQPALPNKFNNYGGVSLTETRAHDFTSSKKTCIKKYQTQHSVTFINAKLSITCN